jgi:nucleotide-binding universal stress UspA family protein
MAIAAPIVVITITPKTTQSAHPSMLLNTAQARAATMAMKTRTCTMVGQCQSIDGSANAEEEMISSVAVGTDGSDTAAKAVDFAMDLAKKYDARLVVISSYRPVSESRLKQEQKDAPDEIQWSINPTEDVEAILSDVEEKAQEAGLAVTTVAGDGDPADVLVNHAEEQNADVLVVGNKGMQRRILGSVPNSVAHKATCTVVVVKTT